MTRRSTLLRRPRLTDLLEVVLDRRLSLLVAPPGFGKSVLLEQWQTALDGRATTALVRLEFAHNNAELFRFALAEAVRPALPALDWAAGEAISPHDLPAFGAAVAARPRADLPFVVMFDDLHTVFDPSVLSVLEAALDFLPDDMHVVFASRTPPPLLVAQLRARGSYSSSAPTTSRSRRSKSRSSRVVSTRRRRPHPFTSTRTDGRRASH